MADVLVIFGSISDEKVYNKVCNGLKREKIKFDLEIASAHRNPDEVTEIVKRDYKVIIAGAGLSAALPGFIASQTIRPVIGVPCKGNYQGLDALLSIMQMPPKIPVLAVGVEKTDIAVNEAKNLLRQYHEVTILGDRDIEPVKKAIEIFEKFNILYNFSLKANKNQVNIDFTYFDEPIEQKDELVIYVPLLDKEDDSAEEALNILKHSNHGLWVGINRGENAALAAMEILNLDRRYEEILKGFREISKKK